MAKLTGTLERMPGGFMTAGLIAFGVYILVGTGTLQDIVGSI